MAKPPQKLLPEQEQALGVLLRAPRPQLQQAVALLSKQLATLGGVTPDEGVLPMQLWHFLTARCYSRWGISLPTAVSLKRKNLFRHLESMAGQLQSSFDRLERELVDDPHRAARVQALVETIADAIIGGLPVHEKVQPWLYAQNIFDRGLWVLDRAFPGYRQSGLLFLLVVNPNGANHVR